MEKVSDEMLMAFADGELDEAAAADVARAVAADPALKRRVEEFSISRRAVGESFSADLAEPVPEHLVSAILSSERRAFRTRRVLTSLAAALLIALGIGIYFATMGEDLASRPALAAALNEASTGQTLEREGEAATLLATYRTSSGFCRSFSLLRGDGMYSGLACHTAGRWEIETAMRVSPDTYSPAGGDIAAEAALEKLGAGAALDADAEDAARKSGWE